MQLDLFIDPPTLMNPNKNPIAPDCFRDYDQYSEWLRLGRMAKQPCTICEDCAKGYKEKMSIEGRCHEEWHSIQWMFEKKTVINSERKAEPKKTVKTYEKTGIEYEKLYWEFS